MQNPALPRRKRPAHFPVIERHNRSQIVFVTVCTKGRRRCLASAIVHAALSASWASASQWVVGRYVILPDHVHLFCTPASIDAIPLAGWVKYWKRLSTLGLRAPLADFAWQRDCWDTQLRVGESYSEKWHYVCRNPVRHGLVAQPEDWPYQGEMNRLEWHD